MRPSAFAFLYAVSCFQQATAAPLLSSLGSALTILKEEDFLAQDSPKSASAILVESYKTFAQGKSACTALSEDLWSPVSQDFYAGVNSSLAYQVYLGKYSPVQLFWIKSPNQGPCKAIRVGGTIKNVACSRKLPTLCTHSGAWSNHTFTDNSPQYQVTVPAGPMQVTGFRDKYGWRFDGIKYADFPGRWVHSSVRAASGPVSALNFGDVCWQNEAWRGVPAEGSEDCLYLNIATPYLPDASRRKLKPVLFWIHGGGFTGNSGNIRNYDGVAMAARGDIVVVKINYRLGSFGYLALDGTPITGNYGFGDMITALIWVQENIAYFGGDPNKVTLAGDSAGAASVRAMISTQKAQGLFSGGIIQSMPSGWRGYPGRFTNYTTLSEATTETGIRVLQLTGCDTAIDQVQCLKDLAPSVLNLLTVIASVPVVDYNIFHSRTLPITGGPGYMAHVPILIGVNRDEGGMGGLPFDDPDTPAFDLLKAMGERAAYFLRGEPKNISAMAFDPAFPTPPGPYGGHNVTIRISSDINFKCESWATAYSGTKHHTFPAVYTFTFNRTYQPLWWTEPQCEPPKTAEHPLGDPDQEYFKCHSGEVDFALGMTVYSGEAPRNELDIPFQQLIVDYWTSFIKWKNPNPPKSYLRVRNYWGTLNQIDATGSWEKFQYQNPKMRWLQWNGGQVPLSEGPQCVALDIPLDYYE
ncbi:uncharacterized protein DFL_003075 [Arthrobotrys flagrans]|uniref:Carboxylic ester hydrolase n=1 Tax=Arthrobotrys flagrans TaxID=97331 RepID=A0A437ACI4_ARTFL|nr:hypothetical protein DFL_003075 [Arthrobotrys flagrans]